MAYTRVLFAGSFAPFTYGHLSVVCEALSNFDEVVIGVGVNPNKKPRFSYEEIVNMINLTIADFISMVEHKELINKSFSHIELKAAKLLKTRPNCVKVIRYEGMTVDAAIKCGANFLIRGKRNQYDLEYENRLARINKELADIRGVNLQTIILPASNDLLDVSSNTVNNLMSMGEYAAAMRYVSPSVHNLLSLHYLKDVYCKMTEKKSWDVALLTAAKRKYHNFTHIAYCLNMFDVYRLFDDSKSLVVGEAQLAFFWHDVKQGENAVKESADLAEKELESVSCNKEWLRSLILATDHETADFATLSENVVHDVDLAILGDDKNYGLYAWKVLLEYEDKVARDVYASERIKVLQSLLNKDKIFYTDYFYNRFEKSARTNIHRELDFWLSI